MNAFPRSLDRLLHPRSVAVIGASDDVTRIGGRPIAYMRSQGFTGRILPVNPGRATVQGLPAYASVAALPETPDVAIVAVAARSVVEVVSQLAERGTTAAIVFSAGFAESGDDGAALQHAMVLAARRHGMRLLGPNSLGIVNPRTGFFGSFLSSVELGMPRPGRVAIVSQSGAYGGHLLAAATAAGIGLSACVMTGNESDITLGDVVRMMVEDADTDVIALYSEGVREAGGLVTALEAARVARKPVVIMKVGKSAVGGAAAQSHTASIAGNDAVIDAVLAELGAVRAASTEQMLDIARLATRRIYPADNALGVITVSGGAGVIASDAAEDVGLPVPQMPDAAQAALKALLPFASPRNPVDVTAQFLNDLSLVGRFTETLVAEGGYPSILGFFTYTAGAPSVAPRLRAELSRVRERHPDRLFVLCVQASAGQIRGYEDDGFCVFEDPTRAVVAIEAMGRFGRSFAAAPRQPAPVVDVPALPAATPSEAEAKRLLAVAGIASGPEHACATADAAVAAAREIGFPVVLKVLSPDILHKSEIGGVLLDVKDEASVRSGFGTLLERAGNAMPQARIEGVLVARQLSGAVECILGIHRDPVFGPVAMFGLGGIFVEVMKDVVFHRCPFGEDVALRMIRSIKGAPLLQGARGRPPADIAALARMLSRLSAFAVAAGPRLQSIDLNPVFAMPEGQGAYAADAVIELLAEEKP
ncbi:MAG: acetate--CoA ligase family protein [Burkholderiales bacterium]|nr:acetate--CoA ligase family protein [Burkholderiales bacterium]